MVQNCFLLLKLFLFFLLLLLLLFFELELVLLFLLFLSFFPFPSPSSKPRNVGSDMGNARKLTFWFNVGADPRSGHSSLMRFWSCWIAACSRVVALGFTL